MELEGKRWEEGGWGEDGGGWRVDFALFLFFIFILARYHTTSGTSAESQFFCQGETTADPERQPPRPSPRPSIMSLLQKVGARLSFRSKTKKEQAGLDGGREASSKPRSLTEPSGAKNDDEGADEGGLQAETKKSSRGFVKSKGGSTLFNTSIECL